MKQFLKKAPFPLLLSLLLLANGCQNTIAITGESGESEETSSQSTSAVNTAAVIDTGSLFSDRDLDGSYDEESAVAISLEGDTASCSSDGVSIQDGQILISQEGVYLISGTLEDGQIIINAGDTDKVQLVLEGASLTSSTSAPIYSLQADKVFITLAEGSENTLANGGEFVAIDENNIDGVIFSKTDLTLNGSGSLSIVSPAGHGVVSKDDLVVTGGTYQVEALNHGLEGKDSLSIAGGAFSLTCGKDGLRSENTEDASLGSVYIQNGEFQIDAQGDAVSASGALQVDSGTFSIVTAGGSETVTMDTGEDFGQGRTPFPGSSSESDAASEDASTDTASAKGLKADGTIFIQGGAFSPDPADDSIHAGGDISITAGTFLLQSGDDAIHSDSNLLIQDGDFTIPYCYEGIEGLSITIDGGTFQITSQDDGLNAAGGADSSGFGMRQQDQFASSASSDSFILINGGTFTITSQGDCIDSNGDLTINGGTLDLTCNGSGNTALDTDGSYANNGGTVTTNDGSEENPGAMGGGQGGMGGKMGGGRQNSTTPPSSTAP